MAGDDAHEFWEIEYFSGDVYKGELRGQSRHGIGMFTYTKTGETVRGMWKNNYMKQGGKKHPMEEVTGELVPLAVMRYEGGQKRS